MQTTIDVGAWVQMFRDVGLSEADMKRWHAIFERRHPQAHGSFLEWLGLPRERIEEVRANARGDEEPA